MLHLFRPVKYGGITSYDITLCVDFFKNDHNQVNIEYIMISEHVEKILPRRMSTTACSFASRFG